MASQEAWSARAGEPAAATAGDGGSLDTNNTGGGATDEAAIGAGDDAVARMSKKRQLMEQLIQKSMGMVPRTFEHEAVPATGSQQHVGLTTAATASSSVGGDRAGSSSRTAETSAGNHDGDDKDPQLKQLRLSERTNGKHSWTQEEDAKLCDLVRQQGRSQWAKVAVHFPTRDRKRCRERFVNHLDPQLKQQERRQDDTWTDDEETLLVGLHRELGNKWATIARNLPGRSPEDVKNRFLARAARQQLAIGSQSSSQAGENEPRVKTRAPPKRWSKDEAKTLRSLVQTHGATNWLFLASHLPGRTDLQCMQQWFQVLDPAVVKGRGTWTSAEDATLLAKVHELGTKWTQVSGLLCYLV